MLGWVISVCLLLQPLGVPLHLLLEEHGVGHGDAPALLAAVPSHAHVHADDHAHGHGHHHHHGVAAVSVKPAELDSDPHCPHPAEDHLAGVKTPAGLPKADSLPIALPCEPVAEERTAPHTAALVVRASDAPPRPPPRRHAPPRAPPAV